MVIVCAAVCRVSCVGAANKIQIMHKWIIVAF